jgi:branched-subunit amino acid ABC-type transport system permease component
MIKAFFGHEENVDYSILFPLQGATTGVKGVLIANTGFSQLPPSLEDTLLRKRLILILLGGIRRKY